MWKFDTNSACLNRSDMNVKTITKFRKRNFVNFSVLSTVGQSVDVSVLIDYSIRGEMKD